MSSRPVWKNQEFQRFVYILVNASIGWWSKSLHGKWLEITTHQIIKLLSRVPGRHVAWWNLDGGFKQCSFWTCSLDKMTFWAEQYNHQLEILMSDEPSISTFMFCLRYSPQVRSGLNSHCFPILRNNHGPHKDLYNHSTDSPLKGGMTIQINYLDKCR